MVATIWDSIPNIVTALKGGLGLLTEAPNSYYLVLGIIMVGLKFSRKMIVRK